MKEEYSGWSTRRHTGLHISWHYSPVPQLEPARAFHYDNQWFTLLANVIHQESGLSQDLEEVLADNNRQKVMEAECRAGKVSSTVTKILEEKFENISSSPIHEEEISGETLEIATQIYLGLTFCPSVQDVVQFYRDLTLGTVPLETVLKTLARILYVANGRELSEHYQIAKSLFDIFTEQFDMFVFDIFS